MPCLPLGWSSCMRCSWLTGMCGTRFWTLCDATPAHWGRAPEPLPSDAGFREDLQALQHGGDVKDAQLTKERLENSQRNDAKLRKPFIEALLAAHPR